MIDFTNAIEEFNNYKGSEKKKTLIYDNKKYNRVLCKGAPEVIKGLLKEVLGKLVNNEKLDEKYCDHALKGKYLGFRDCHIKPDLVLIYKIEHNALLLYLANIGSHSELGI